MSGPLIPLIALSSAAGMLTAGGLDPEDDVVRELAVEIELDDSGTMHVTETYQWDFGEREGLGFYRSLVQEQEADDGGSYHFEFSDFTFDSPSGAPAEIVEVDEDGDELLLSLGAPDDSDQTRSGVQTYELSYQVDGAVLPEGISWFAAGPSAEVPHERVVTTVTGPAEILQAHCRQGEPESLTSCSAEHDGTTATLVAEDLAPGEGQVVEVSFPEGTFPADAAIYREPTALAQWGHQIAPAADRTWSAVSSVWLPGGAAAAALLAGFAALRLRRGRDWHYPDLQPGQLPTPDQRDQLATARLTHEPEPQLRAEPPADLSPVEAAMLWHKSASAQTADLLSLTVVDLAARGHLSLEQTTRGEDDAEDWLLHRREPAGADELRSWEADLLAGMFAGKTTVVASELGEEFHSAQQAAVQEVRKKFDDRRLLERPMAAVAMDGWLAIAAAGLLLAGFVAIFGLASPLPDSVGYLGGVAAGFFLIMLIIQLCTAQATTSRTALGRAYYEQLRGLDLYLRSSRSTQADQPADPAQITALLPYAMALGHGEEWGQLMDQHASDVHGGSVTGRSTGGLNSGSWAVLIATLPNSVGAAHAGSSAGGFSGGGFSGGAMGGGGVAGR